MSVRQRCLGPAGASGWGNPAGHGEDLPPAQAGLPGARGSRPCRRGTAMEPCPVRTGPPADGRPVRGAGARCAGDRGRAGTVRGRRGGRLAWHVQGVEPCRPDLVQALFTPFPPVHSGLRLAAGLRAAGGVRPARNLALPVRRLGERKSFQGEGGRVGHPRHRPARHPCQGSLPRLRGRPPRRRRRRW